MAANISYDANAPTAAVELPIIRSLPDYDLVKVEAGVPREIDPILASQGFKDLLDEARSILDLVLAGSGLEITQLTGAICVDGGVYRPGIWMVLHEPSPAAGQTMSEEARKGVAAAAEDLRTRLGLS
jgi:hypothetical protein